MKPITPATAASWLEDWFHRASKGVLRQAPERMIAPGYFVAKPTCAEDLVGAFARDDDGTHVCQPDGGGYSWVLLEAAPAVTAPALVFITGATFSASSAVNVDNCFSATYENYQIVISNMSQSNGVDWQMRMRVGGADNSTAGSYLFGGNYSTQGGANNAFGSGGTTFWGIHQVANAASSGRTTIEVARPFLADTTDITWHGITTNGTVLRAVRGGGHHTQATSYDGFTIFPASNTITGTYRVYGVADS